MKSKKVKLIVFAALTLVFMSIGIKSYALCIECYDLQPNPGLCMSNECGYLNQYGTACCGNTIY